MKILPLGSKSSTTAQQKLGARFKKKSHKEPNNKQQFT